MSSTAGELPALSQVRLTLVSPITAASDTTNVRVFSLENGLSVPVGRCSKNETKNLMPNASNAYFDSKVMSRYHADLIAPSGLPGPVQIIDTSKYGVFVNHEKIPKECPWTLSPGDRLKFGDEVTMIPNPDATHEPVEVLIDFHETHPTLSPTVSGPARGRNTSSYAVPSSDRSSVESDGFDSSEENDIENDKASQSSLNWGESSGAMPTKIATSSLPYDEGGSHVDHHDKTSGFETSVETNPNEDHRDRNLITIMDDFEDDFPFDEPIDSADEENKAPSALNEYFFESFLPSVRKTRFDVLPHTQLEDPTSHAGQKTDIAPSSHVVKLRIGTDGLKKVSPSSSGDEIHPSRAGMINGVSQPPPGSKESPIMLDGPKSFDELNNSRSELTRHLDNLMKDIDGASKMPGTQPLPDPFPPLHFPESTIVNARTDMPQTAAKDIAKDEPSKAAADSRISIDNLINTEHPASQVEPIRGHKRKVADVEQKPASADQPTFEADEWKHRMISSAMNGTCKPVKTRPDRPSQSYNPTVEDCWPGDDKPTKALKISKTVTAPTITRRPVTRAQVKRTGQASGRSEKVKSYFKTAITAGTYATIGSIATIAFLASPVAERLAGF